MTEFRNVKGHVEIFMDGVFLFSADDEEEAEEELNTQGDTWLFSDLNEVIDMC